MAGGGAKCDSAGSLPFPSAAAARLTRPTTPCCFFTTRGVGKKRPRAGAGGRADAAVCMAALIRTWLLFLRRPRRGRLNEPLGVDYDTCAKPMNRRGWLSVRVLQIGEEGEGTGELLRGLYMERPAGITSELMFVLPTLLDAHPVVPVEQRKQREGNVLLPLARAVFLPRRRLPFDRFHRSVVPVDPIDVESESDGRQMPLQVRKEEGAAVVERRTTDRLTD